MARRGVIATFAAGLSIAGVLLLFALQPSSAAAHWAGFTGEWWWCKANESANDSANGDYYVLSVGGNECVTSPIHSYGFSSGTDVSYRYEVVYFCVDIRTPQLNATYSGASCTGTPARVCVDGVYPNCHDSDGYSARGMTWIQCYLSCDTRRVKGHSWY